MSVRIIAGKAKGRRLKVRQVAGLRPTSDRARETLFNVLAPQISNARFLDMFAGSGAVGIEALSRGASAAVFIEQDERVVTELEANLELCCFSVLGRVVHGSWQDALRRVGSTEDPFDIIFLDPPYDWVDTHTCVAAVFDHAMVSVNGVLIVEHRSTRDVQLIADLELLRQISVGDTAFSIFTARGNAEILDRKQ
jgi:16S rRNA (guanine(966)-N(2))-methyltransferase RsmD|tara:strand:+ start:1615 stop:2199 length:585 start_codon:yes stop_codon:yes gene_type:complete